jgi:hypothetical protein
MISLHLFKSIKNLGLMALTFDEDGINLPSDLGPWKFGCKSIPIRLNPTDVLWTTFQPELALNGYVLSSSPEWLSYHRVYPSTLGIHG